MKKAKVLIFPACFLALFAAWASPTRALDASGWFEKGNQLNREGRHEEAVQAFRKSLEQNPRATVALHNLGLTYKKLKQYEKAAETLEKAVALEPQNLNFRLSLGNIYNLQERWEKAIGQLNQVVHRRRNDAEAHGNLGWAYYNYSNGPPFKFLVILNLELAIQLFEEQNMVEAAEATRRVLNEALKKYGSQLRD